MTGHGNQPTIKPALITKGSPGGPGLLLSDRLLIRFELDYLGHLLMRLCQGWHFLVLGLGMNNILTSLGRGAGLAEWLILL